MPRRFPLLTDEHISKALIKALRERGWDVIRAIDVFGQKTDDQVLFEYAIEHERVFVTTMRVSKRSASAGCGNGGAFLGSSSGPSNTSR